MVQPQTKYVLPLAKGPAGARYGYLLTLLTICIGVLPATAFLLLTKYALPLVKGLVGARYGYILTLLAVRIDVLAVTAFLPLEMCALLWSEILLV